MRFKHEIVIIGANLDLTHLGEECISEKLSEISSFVQIYMGIDPAKELIPTQPTCHYMMGGIPTNRNGQVLGSNHENIKGLYAVGECACVSVHGANRLGCNSLLDLMVFGRRTGKKILKDLVNIEWTPLPNKPKDHTLSKINCLKERTSGEKTWNIRNEMQETMTSFCSVFRNKEGLSKSLETIDSLIARYENIKIDDATNAFNTDLIVDLEPFFEKVRSVKPYLMNSSSPPEKERQQSPEESRKIDIAIRCILCACCMGACPVVSDNGSFLGPAPLVWAFRYIFDSRDKGYLERLKSLDYGDGVLACENHFECTRCCPKEIPVTKYINTLKRKIQKNKE
ncbi:FAD-binding protein [Candidatus Scalindua japonica]|uniref:FAD-binding protein n=1 Tax=Candidatus Scalindua japonica TaxID=1284222 RepID=UPI000BDEDB5D|nr:FAD-binding protein [Candidatus Scalindua japonica]